MHGPILGSRRFTWSDEAACAACAAEMARRLLARPELADACLELQGPLGAGKTSFVRHLLRALGVRGRIKSPTYAVLESYELPAPMPGPISHFDFYRFAHASEWADAGFREVFAAPGLKISEWPENAAGQLPAPDLQMLITPRDGAGAETREVAVTALSPRGLAWIA